MAWVRHLTSPVSEPDADEVGPGRGDDERVADDDREGERRPARLVVERPDLLERDVGDVGGVAPGREDRQQDEDQCSGHGGRGGLLGGRRSQDAVGDPEEGRRREARGALAGAGRRVEGHGTVASRSVLLGQRYVYGRSGLSGPPIRWNAFSDPTTPPTRRPRSAAVGRRPLVPSPPRCRSRGNVVRPGRTRRPRRRPPPRGGGRSSGAVSMAGRSSASRRAIATAISRGASSPRRSRSRRRAAGRRGAAGRPTGSIRGAGPSSARRREHRRQAKWRRKRSS